MKRHHNIILSGVLRQSTDKSSSRIVQVNFLIPISTQSSLLSSSSAARMYTPRARTLDELKERVLALPVEALTDSEKERCLKEETLRDKSSDMLRTLLLDKRFTWLLTCDKIRNTSSRKKIYDYKSTLLRSLYCMQLIESELMRREVPSNDPPQQLPTSPTQYDPSLEELDSIDLDLVCFEDLVDDLDNVSTDDIEPLPLSFNPDDLLDFTAEDIACLFD